MKKRLFLVLYTSLFVVTVFGQDFKGVIVNAKQRPLKGMKVWKKNTTESVKTDNMGVFSFSGLQPTDTLVVSISKKEEAIIPIGKLFQASLKLEKKFFILFDGQKEEKREYTRILRTSYNSNVLTREQIQKLSANSIYDLFKGGAIPGVTVNGDKITIRGGSSFDLDNEPLFVVDGTLYESSSEVDGVVSINDIDKVEIQKDGAAYGMKGANGVIIITTIKK
ncbi:TonB-dependent receptor plug domain-containing protein [uncultured Bacteroides sp.]|jgi:hypothetical protein|uniref:TonB-dependent receptor plug domain-containing protein n=1 Tax=uncultured Bacteroides sp. TaxID=162156 RepID=UPI002620A36B|nr:TonB-dependent receptor plug domain-containing protein [uncultured Bacteroides sp.]